MREEGSEPIGFYNLGVAYLDCARFAQAQIKKLAFRDPIEFLIAHGLELIFKADLRRDRTLEEVRATFGHNLPKLFLATSEDFRAMFAVDDSLSEVVNYLAEGHSGPDWRNRYLQTGCRTNVIPDSRIIEALAPFTTQNRSALIAHFSKRGT